MILSLYNKNVIIADVEFNMQRGYIAEIKKLHNPEYFPLGLVNDKKEVDLDKVNDWWEERSIPDTRKNVEKVLEYIQKEKYELIIQSLGLSLSDQYWIKPKESNIEWTNVNFFTNDFPKEIGELFFYQKGIHESDQLKFSSPDLTANGFLDKRWIVQDGERFLCKNGYDTFRQQPFNEKIASDLLKQVGCKDYVVYDLKDGNKNEPYSLCKNFVTANTEYIPASLIRKITHKKTNETEHDYFMRCCDKFNMKQAMEKYLDYTIPFDYLIGNIDRNYGNFGVIRNVETLKIEKMAPIFDNGNSLWYNDVFINQHVKSYPFLFSQEAQIKLVKDMTRFPLHKMTNLSEICLKTLKTNKRCSIERMEMISKALQERKQMLEKFLQQ